MPAPCGSLVGNDCKISGGTFYLESDTENEACLYLDLLDMMKFLPFGRTCFFGEKTHVLYTWK